MFDACGRSSHAIFCTCLDCYSEAVLITQIQTLRLPLLFPLAVLPVWFSRIGSWWDPVSYVRRFSRFAMRRVRRMTGRLELGGCCSWLSRGDTNSRLIYRGIYMDLPIWSGEAIGLPPIHDMDVRKWLFGVIWSWKRSELRLVHDPTSLTHF